MDLRGTETETNLLTSFAGESQARMRYTFYASQAKKEGYPHIADVFHETANHEKEHAERFFKFLKEGGATPMLKVEWDFPSGPLAGTEENLRAAAEGEKHEFSEMYPGYADIAEEEGFSTIAYAWRMIAKAETWHHERYIALAEQLKEGTLLKRERKIEWRCSNCGYRHEGDTPPAKCPACDHDQAYFMVHYTSY